MNQRDPYLTFQVGNGSMLTGNPQATASSYHGATLMRLVALSRVHSRTRIRHCAFRIANTVANVDRSPASTWHMRRTTGEACGSLECSMKRMQSVLGASIRRKSHSGEVKGVKPCLSSLAETGQALVGG
jgi:hypothetical protein